MPFVFLRFLSLLVQTGIQVLDTLGQKKKKEKSYIFTDKKLRVGSSTAPT